MRNPFTVIVLVMLTFSSRARADEPAKPSGSDAEAVAMLSQFILPGADHAALTKQLRPTSEDYAKVFTPDFAKTAEEGYAKAWDGGAMVIAPKEGQTELLMGSSATTDDIKDGTDAAKEFPNGWRNIADQLNRGITIHRFKFVKPGETSGMAFDGLMFVNGHWIIVPKPWRFATKMP